MGLQCCRTRQILLLALLPLLLHAAAGTALIRIVSPRPPVHGLFTCKSRVLHVRATISSSVSLDDSTQIAFFVDGQQVALVAARSHSEVRFHPSSPSAEANILETFLIRLA
jgi:hypothetical protein